MRAKLPLALLLVSAALSSCATYKERDSLDDPTHLHVEGFDPLAVIFLEGRPKVGDSILQSLDNEAGALEVLADNLESLKSNPRITFQVTGWTDDAECKDLRSCTSLSLLRASLVTRWYREHGAMNLTSPEGLGAYLALPIRPTNQDRRIARRAELKVK